MSTPTPAERPPLTDKQIESCLPKIKNADGKPVTMVWFQRRDVIQAIHNALRLVK